MAEALDVLVVGGGPTGLTLGGELLRRGLRARVIDKATAPSTLSKAVGVHARTLEIFDDLGIADALIARGLRVRGATMRAGVQVIVSVDFSGLATRFPFILCLPQYETESVLAELLARRGGTVERGLEVVSLAQDATGVDAVVRGPNGDETVRARWIVGCDGAHSTVRHALGATFNGHAYAETFVLADIQVDWDAEPDRVATYFASDGVVAMFPLPGGRWRVVGTGAELLGEQPTLDDVRALVERRVGTPVPMHDPRWITTFKVNCRQVDRYVHGRAILAGDAAHVHSPIGGQGMNTGIQDAHNLAWKLALIAHGHAREELLESYHSERHAIGRHVLRETDVATKLGMLKGIAGAVRNHVARFVTSFEPVRHHIARDAAELTVGYHGSPIVGEHVSSLLTARIGNVEATETPTVGSHLAFARGPKAGTRLLDAELIAADGTTTRLAELCRGDAFTVLLFDGRSGTTEGDAALIALVRRVRTSWGEHVRVHVVTPRAGLSLGDDVNIVVDTSEAETHYGAQSECAYIVRPDLYIGFRCQPIDADAVDTHLAALLTRRPAPAA